MEAVQPSPIGRRTCATDDALRGVLFGRQFPNPAEPLRAPFVRTQLAATLDRVEWEVVAPVPYVPRRLADTMGWPYVRGDGEESGVPVSRPRYPVLPRRMLYSTVAGAMARASADTFRRVVDRLGARFVHAHELYPSGAAARMLTDGSGLPLVVTVHGSDLYTNVEVPSWREHLKRTVDGCARVVCVSRALATDLTRLLPVDADRVVVVPDAYDGETFRPIARHRDPSGRTRLVTVGRLAPEKGQDVLLEALARLRARGMHAALTLVGSGPADARLHDLAERLRLGDSVRFAGTLTGDDLVAVLADSDLFVLPSLREGFGVALVEAMATGLPAVATRSGGPADIVRAPDGILVQPGDPDALAAGIEEAAGVLEAFDGRAVARGAAERFSASVVGARLVDLYVETIEGATR